MKDENWLEYDDDALEKRLLERWLFRGVLLVVMLAAAVSTTYMGAFGLDTILERLLVGALVCVTLSSAAAAFVMRNTDIRMHRELRRRRAPAAKSKPAG